MALNPKEPRLFASTEDAARAYQQRRLAADPRSQPFRTVGCCAVLIPDDLLVTPDGGAVPTQPVREYGDQPAAGSAKGTAWAAQGPDRDGRKVELWTTRRTPFETDQSPQQKAMIRQLAPRLQTLRCDTGERLHGIFASDELASRQPDAENITFFNFGSAPFAGASHALGFERCYEAAPPPPSELGASARYHHSWQVVPVDEPFQYWVEGNVVAAWDEVPIDLAGDLGLAAWRALRENPGLVNVAGRLTSEEYFGIRVTLTHPAGHGLSIVKALKALVDGPLAGLQRTDELPADVTAKLLRRRWGRAMDAATLAELVAAEEPSPVLPRAPFNKNGLDPCDELCVAGIVQVEHGHLPPRLAGRVFRMAPSRRSGV